MVVLTVVLVSILQFQQGNAAGIVNLIGGALVAIVMGFILSTLATYIALLNAWRYNVRFWLNGAIHIARRKNEWPPLYGHSNRVLVLVISTALMSFLVLAPILLALIVAALTPAIGRQNAAPLQALGILFSVFVLLPMSGMMIRRLRQRQFFAGHPADCWGDEPLPERNRHADNWETW
jgi:hypothetical protein